jgi:hypothetical protein
MSASERYYEGNEPEKKQGRITINADQNISIKDLIAQKDFYLQR